MTLRLALASAPQSLRERYGSLAGAASTEPAFALVCLGAVAQARNWTVALFDASAESRTIDETAADVLAFQPDILGLTATTAGVTAAAALAARIKQARPDTLTVLGGCHASSLPEETLRQFPHFDLLAVGEGEATLTEILDAVQGGQRRPAGISGTAWREGDAIRVGPPRPVIQNLDELPLPAWSLLRGFPGAFRPSPARIKRWPCASVVLTRGCPNQCAFCDRSVFGHRCRGYSPARAVEMVKDLRQHYGVRELLIEDDTFVIVPARVTEFCERLIADRIDITWSCLGRADRVNPEVLRLMRRAGCWHISFGIESGDPAILKAMRKNLDLAEIRQAIQWSRQAGLRTKGFFIVGFPGDSESSFRATRSFARSLDLDDISVMQLTPFPGSELYEQARALGTFDADWTRMNTIETVFVPTGLTRQDLENARARMLREFYFRPLLILRHMLHLLRNPRLIPGMLAGLGALLKTARLSREPEHA